MSLPFSTTEFHDVFRRYNEAVWPAQWGLAALGVATVLAAAYGGRARRSAWLALAVLWAWMGIVYHLGFFARINPAAILFGTLFVVQAALFARAGLRHDSPAFAVRRDARGLLGAVLAVYALVAYPLLGMLAGHWYPMMATFGLPCPTTILTLGMLVWAAPHASRGLFAIPLAWAAIGSSATASLGMREDYGLLVAGLLAAGTLIVPRHLPRPLAPRAP